MKSKTTLVIGASENPERYSQKAILALQRNKHDVVALAKREGNVNGIPIVSQFPEGTQIDTVTLYLGPERQAEYYASIVALNPNRVIFNPGTENKEFATLLKQNGIVAEEACTLVLLSLGAY